MRRLPRCRRSAGGTELVDPDSLFPREGAAVQVPAYEDKEHEAADGLDGQSKVPFNAAKLGSEGQE